MSSLVNTMSLVPFSVLHVCLGNICRSPMAERLLVAAARRTAGPAADTLLASRSAGTGGWHAGEPMNPPAARQVRVRGGDDTQFAARQLRTAHIDNADLVLTATAEHAKYVTSLRPDAAPRTFVLGEFGRLLPLVAVEQLPAGARTVPEVRARGVALVAAVHALRGGAAPLPSDDVDDPWGRSDAFFSRVADEIDRVVSHLAAVLFGGTTTPNGTPAAPGEAPAPGTLGG